MGRTGRFRGVVKQGDIVKVNFNPQQGHEQVGYRPALVISNNDFIANARLAIVCPITNTRNNFPLHIPLPDTLTTTGVLLCEHIRTLDLNARQYNFVETVPADFLQSVIDIVFAEIEII